MNVENVAREQLTVPLRDDYIGDDHIRHDIPLLTEPDRAKIEIKKKQGGPPVTDPNAR